ncbi:hypothetical protein [Leucothrix pacifica]|uniref:Uncharacterized protein n=1 Tax=Leucothrix pacifica TaxID=1247513 RepID=A0A317CPN1_9GAMM|nr:hypothetical protein [Leucothrix pacifica]PWR00519.1 hypothetical protein DKW60_01490 [Leucothrix pacifica]
MNTPPLLQTFLLCCLFSSVNATTQPPVDADATKSSEAAINNDLIAKVMLTDEEQQFIEAECMRFAVDDEVPVDDLADYIAICNSELTVAVKTALLERRAKAKGRARISNKVKSRTPDQPQPL